MTVSSDIFLQIKKHIHSYFSENGKKRTQLDLSSNLACTAHYLHEAGQVHLVSVSLILFFGALDVIIS